MAAAASFAEGKIIFEGIPGFSFDCQRKWSRTECLSSFGRLSERCFVCNRPNFRPCRAEYNIRGREEGKGREEYVERRQSTKSRSAELRRNDDNRDGDGDSLAREKGGSRREEETEVNERGLGNNRESTRLNNSFTHISPTRAFAVVRLMRVEQGRAFLDVLLGEGEAAWQEEMLYVERTLGFKTAPVDARQLRQVTDLVGGTVRWQRYLDYLVAQYFHGEQRDLDRMEPMLLQILRLGLYEIVKCDHPSYAVINEVVELAKSALRPGAGHLANGILRKVARDKAADRLPRPAIEGDSRSRARALATIHSHPVWLVRRWVAQFGEEEAVRLLEWNNERPFFSLRANVLRGVTRDVLVERLKELQLVDFEPSPYLEDFIRLRSGMQEVLYAGLLKDGICSVQDESAGLVISLLGPRAGETVVDCCAAPGGKTLFAAARMGGTGRILAVDANEGRALLVKQAAERQGVAGMVETVAADIRQIAKEGGVRADRVLLDSPCSGLGVLSKRADLRWRRTPESIEELVTLQDELLEAAASLVRPGGVLVYSTCSIERDENSDRVEAFLSRHADFKIESAAGILPDQMVTPEGYFASLPHRHSIDGAFAARLRRTAEGSDGNAQQQCRE